MSDKLQFVVVGSLSRQTEVCRTEVCRTEVLSDSTSWVRLTVTDSVTLTESVTVSHFTLTRSETTLILHRRTAMHSLRLNLLHS